MPLKEVTVEVNWPTIHYVYVEKEGPIQEVASQCWAEFYDNKPHISDDPLYILGYMSLYKPSFDKYCAGGTVAKIPTEPLPPAVKHMELEGGRYLQYTVMGNYSQLPDALKKILLNVEEGGIVTRGSWYIEHYVNRVETTPEDELTTHILVPIP